MTLRPTPPVATAEWLALAISRLIREGERVSIGTNLPVARAGALLAKLTHAPHTTLYLGMAEVQELPPTPPAFTALAGEQVAAVRHHALEDFFAHADQVDFFVVGAMQIDPFGNTNLLGIGPLESTLAERYRGRTVFGPGSIGTATMTTYARRYALFAPGHSPRVFVPDLAFRSTCGWGTGGQERDALGLPGGGPVACVTNMGVFDYPARGHRMRMVRPFEGYTFAEVQDQTGFPVIRPAKLQEFPRPSALELRVLREQVDPLGLLRA